MSHLPLPRPLTLALCLALVALVAVAFGQAAWFDFTTYDDPEWIAANPQVQAGLSRTGATYAITTPILGHWAPLTVLSHMAACSALGVAPGPHHTINVALHAAGVVILFLALRSLTGAPWRSAIVAALFAVHPMRTESVFWITERKDVLSGIFFFATLWAYAAWSRHRTALRYAVVMLLFACGLMAKSMLVTLPFVLLLLDFWPLQRTAGWQEWRRCALEKLPLLALSAVSAFLQYRLVQHELIPVDALGWIARISNAALSYGIYVGQLFWTGPLAVFYPHPGRPDGWQLAIAVAAILALTVLTQRHGATHRYLWTGWLWYLGMLVPVIGLIQSGEIARANRYTYLPHIGLLIMLVWGAADLVARWRVKTLWPIAATALALVAAMLATRAQAAHWRNDETLWRHALAVTTNNHHAHTSLGVIEAKRGNFSAAIDHFREAARLSPTYWRAYGNLAQVLLATGDTRSAMEAAERALHLNPGEPALARLLAETRRAHAAPLRAQAEAALREGRYAEAVELHERAMHFDAAPLPAAAFAQLLANAGQLPAAETTLREALAIDPHCDDATLELAYVREHLGALNEAAQLYRQVLDRQPSHVTALAGLAEIFLRNGQINEALPLVEKALAIQPNDGPSLYVLGTIRLMQGQSAEAVKIYRQALAARADMPEAQANLAWILATSTEDTLRNGAEAVRWARSACEGPSGQDPAMLRILAAAHAEAGQFPEALTVIERAITLAQSLGDANLANRLTMQRGLYQNHQPLRVPLR